MSASNCKSLKFLEINLSEDNAANLLSFDSKASNKIKKFETANKNARTKKHILFLLFGCVIGAINGFFGAGGGMLAVPVLGFVGRLSARKAHATAIAVMLPLCLVSSIVYAVSGAVDFAVLLPTAIGVLAGGIVGAKLLGFLPEILLNFVFYSLMLLAGLKMLF